MAGVGRTSLGLVPIAIVCRGAAFLVPMAVAGWFGVDRVTDAWFWAISFPTFMLVLAATALGTTATPILSRVRAADSTREPRLVGGLAVWAGAASILFGLGVALAAPALLRHTTSFDAATSATARLYLWELVPFMALVGVGAPLRTACEVRGRFAGVAATPLVRAVTIVVSTWALLGPLGRHALPWGLVAGEVAGVCWWTGILRRDGLSVRPSLDLDPELRRVAGDLAPILGGQVLSALNLVVDKGFAATLEAGSVATLEYADRARVIPQTLLESTLVMVAFATWSNLRAAGREEEARASMNQSLRWTLAVGAPVLAGMFVGRTVLVRLMFERGAFGPGDTEATAAVLAWFVPGILPNLLGILAVRAHVVLGNLRLVLGLGIASVLLNAGLDAVLMGPFGIAGIALATSLVVTAIPMAFLAALGETLDPRRSEWAPAVAVAFGSAAVAVVVEMGPGAPESLLDPWLWGAAVACVGLLVVGWRRESNRPEGASVV